MISVDYFSVADPLNQNRGNKMGTYMDHVEYAYIERLQEDIDIAVCYLFNIDLLTPVLTCVLKSF